MAEKKPPPTCDKGRERSKRELDSRERGRSKREINDSRRGASRSKSRPRNRNESNPKDGKKVTRNKSSRSKSRTRQQPSKPKPPDNRPRTDKPQSSRTSSNRASRSRSRPRTSPPQSQSRATRTSSGRKPPSAKKREKYANDALKAITAEVVMISGSHDAQTSAVSIFINLLHPSYKPANGFPVPFFLSLSRTCPTSTLSFSCPTLKEGAVGRVPQHCSKHCIKTTNMAGTMCPGWTFCGK